MCQNWFNDLGIISNEKVIVINIEDNINDFYKTEKKILMLQN